MHWSLVSCGYKENLHNFLQIVNLDSSFKNDAHHHRAPMPSCVLCLFGRDMGTHWTKFFLHNWKQSWPRSPEILREATINAGLHSSIQHWTGVQLSTHLRNQLVMPPIFKVAALLSVQVVHKRAGSGRSWGANKDCSDLWQWLIPMWHMDQVIARDFYYLGRGRGNSRRFKGGSPWDDVYFEV